MMKYQKITKVSKNLHQIQKNLKMRMIKKYLKKDMYLQKEDRKLLMILDPLQQYNNGISNTKSPNQTIKFRTKIGLK